MAPQPGDDDKKKKDAEEGGPRLKPGRRRIWNNWKASKNNRTAPERQRQEHEQADEEGDAVPDETYLLIDNISNT